MGILVDSNYWNDACESMWGAIPTGNWKTITTDQAERVRAIGCRVLTALVEDPELELDVKKLNRFTTRIIQSIRKSRRADDFFARFIEAERALFEKAGRHLEITREILTDLEQFSDSIDDLSDWDRFSDQIRLLQTLVCNSIEAENEIEPSLAKRAWIGCKGIFVISTDAAAVAAAGGAVVGGPLGGGLGSAAALPFAMSINAGRLQLIRRALWNRW